LYCVCWLVGVIRGGGGGTNVEVLAGVLLEVVRVRRGSGRKGMIWKGWARGLVCGGVSLAVWKGLGV